MEWLNRLGRFLCRPRLNGERKSTQPDSAPRLTRPGAVPIALVGARRGSDECRAGTFVLRSLSAEGERAGVLRVQLTMGAHVADGVSRPGGWDQAEQSVGGTRASCRSHSRARICCSQADWCRDGRERADRVMQSRYVPRGLGFNPTGVNPTFWSRRRDPEGQPSSR